MPLVEILVGVAVAAVAITAVKLAEILYNKLIFKKAPSVSKYTHDSDYQLAEEDQAYLAASKSVLIDVLGEKPMDAFMAQDAESRVESMKTIMEKLTELYELEGLKIRFYNDINQPILGAYEETEHVLSYNIAFLLTSDPLLLQRSLATVFHEYRHAVQWKMVQSAGRNSYRWYTNDQMVRKITVNYLNYISGSENFQAYYQQFIEVDAREISWYIVEELV